MENFPVLNYIKHVLVDEFQDTNEIQLRLMYHFAKGNTNGDPKYQNNVTIVETLIKVFMPLEMPNQLILKNVNLLYQAKSKFG